MKKEKSIQSYGDEKLVLEGDFYKPIKSGSLFFQGESVVKFRNKTGRINYLK